MDLQTQANEVKKALGETVLLSNGNYGYVISELNDSGPDKWKCHVCSRVITTERAMLMHLSHPIHMSRLRVPHHPPENFKRIVNSKNDATKKKILDPRIQEKEKEKDKVPKKETNTKEETWSNTVRPGEPIPPGMEDIVESKCQIQETLDNYIAGPLIGIEYIVELVSSEDGAEPKYICLLCEKKGDPRSVMVHLTSHNHALRYISCFFRTAGNVINLIPKARENRKGVGMAVSKIAEQIEKHYGRLKPTLAVSETFAQQKYEILRQIDEKEHFRETPSTTYIQYCTPEKIKEYSKIAEDEMLSSIRNSKKPEDFEEIHRAVEKNDTIKPVQPKKTPDKIVDIPMQEKFTGKLSFSIGKPERSLGRNRAPDQANQAPTDDKDDDEVIFVPSVNEPIEVRSMSSISSASDESRMVRYRDRSRSLIRSRSRSRSRGRGRVRSPPRRRVRSIERRRTPPPYRRDRHRSRSRSRSRQRYYRDAVYSRGQRDEIDRIRPYPRAKRSLSREKERERLRYESRMRMERDSRHRRSYSSERDRKRSPFPKGRHDRLSPNKGRHEKSPEIKRKKVVNDYKSKMEAYRTKLHELEVEMDNKLKYFRERPEKHPQYSDEWKNFWNRRYKEIQQTGKDPNTYDFKPEWIIFWDERMKQLHEDELVAKKEELKNILPEEDKGPSSDLQDVSPPTPESQKDVTVDDIKNTWKALTGSDIKAPAKQKSSSPDRKSPPRRSLSPWEQESRISHTKSTKGKHSWDAAPPIVHCLRMLSVLEQQLGSLGPKALELLSKALSMEKSKNNESMTLLHDEEIHIFFETIKEKIRGQLIAGIVVRYLVNSCRSVINTIESMLAAYPPKPKQPIPVAPPAMIQPEPVKVAGVGMVNKMAVAQQIAEVLVSQGRTDVTQQELEELINAVVGIASSTNTNLNQSSAAFISQLNLQKSTANSHINELLGNLIASAQKSLVPMSIVPIEKIVPEIVNQPTVPQISSSLLQHPVTTAPIANVQSALIDTAASNKIEPLIKNIPVSTNKREIPRETTPEEEVEKGTDSVSDEDLKERLIKFKTLTRDEQQNLIALLKDLESKDPPRVEKLRKYVAVGLTHQSSATVSKSDSIENESTKDTGRLSPFSSRAGGTNPAPEEKKILPKPYIVDSDHEDDDDDYSVEDVYKSVSEKLKKKEDERKTEQRLNLSLDILDENSTSSRNSFSNPGKSSITPTPPYSQAKSFNSDPRATSYGNQNPPQPSKNDYMYSVAESPNIQHSESFIPSMDQSYPGQVDSSHYKGGNQWGSGSGMMRENEWSENKHWTHGANQDPYNAPSRVGGYPNSYEGGAYNSGPPEHYKSGGHGSYYGSEQDPGYMGGLGDKPYPPYNANQPYQSGMYNNQGGPPYNYQKPPGQAGYYNNYRQY